MSIVILTITDVLAIPDCGVRSDVIGTNHPSPSELLLACSANNFINIFFLATSCATMEILEGSRLERKDRLGRRNTLV
jgi:hypothetical protein